MKINQNHLWYLANALNYYEGLGFENIKTPWQVSREATEATFSEPIVGGTSLLDNVGSGEQGFVQLMLDGSLPPDRLMTLTPCFRNEPHETEISLREFIKLELFSPSELTSPEIMANMALSFMSCYVSCYIKGTDEGFDIVSNKGLELGSYGVRHYKGLSWVYGTGLAEPRFSISIKEDRL